MRMRFKEVEVEATRAEMGVRSMKHLTAKVQRTAAINKQIYRVDERRVRAETNMTASRHPSVDKQRSEQITDRVARGRWM